MKRILIGLAFLATPAMAQVYVKPHIRADGTYVQGHWRSAPNSTVIDNWSTSPNTNPYTGRRGSHAPEPSYPYQPRWAPPRIDSSPLPERTQQRWRQTMPLTCKYSDIC